jgi:N-ethylmaleimide reductase
MTTDDIRDTIADFARAAASAIDAGFAGVEVHAANGYLLHQFLSPNTNRRTDEYGGTPANRMRFVLEVVRAVVAEVGAERVGVRISPGNTTNGIHETPQEIAELYPALAAELDGAGLAYLHVAFADPHTELWRSLRGAWSGVLIGNPILPADSIPTDGGLAAAQQMLAAGADVVALGRPFLSNPDLVERLRLRAPVNPVRDAYLMYVGGETGYTDYTTLR